MTTHVSASANTRRVLQVLFGGLGGHASVAKSLVASTPELSHSVLFFGRDEPTPENLRWCDELGVRTRSVVKRRGFDPIAWKKVFDAVQRERPHVVIVHSGTTWPALLGARVLGGTPFLLVDHTPHDAKKPREWAALLMGAAAADATVFLTPDALAGVRWLPLGRPKNVHVIPNGIDVRKFSPEIRTSASNDVVLSMASRFTPLRDHRTLIDAAEMLVRRDPSLRSRLRVILAGDGPTWNEVREHAVDRGLGEIVELPGMLDEAALLEVLRRSTVYVHSSLAETMSTSVMQALSTGVPVVATRIHGMDFLVRERETGVLVQPNDPTALAEAIRALLEDPDERARMTAAARLDAETRLSMEVMANRYRSAIGSILPGNGGQCRSFQ